jgi:hypothetical protein
VFLMFWTRELEAFPWLPRVVDGEDDEVEDDDVSARHWLPRV